MTPDSPSFLAISVSAHFAIALYAYTRDQVIERKVDRIARQFQVGQYEPPAPVEPVKVDTNAEEGGEAEQPGKEEKKPKGETKKPRKPLIDPTPSSGEGGGSNDGPSEAAIEETIKESALVAVLTGGEGGASERYGEMSDTDQGASLDQSIEHARGKKTATTGGGGDRRQRGANSGKLGGNKGEKVGGPSGEGTKVAAVEETKVSKVKLEATQDLSLSDLDPDSVARRIRGKYLAGIKRCHQRVLKVDPQAQGRVTIRFTVGPTGRVTKAKVKGFDPTVDACIQGQAKKWRFSTPKDEGKPTSADFEVPLILKPGA